MYSHGAMRVPIYCKRFEQGGTSPTAQPIVVRKNQASALVDGKNSMGMVASKFGMDLAIAMAKQAGSATVSVMGSKDVYKRQSKGSGSPFVSVSSIVF